MPDAHWLDRVAITGATGFIGGHLVRALLPLGYQPVLLAHSPGLHPRLAGLKDRVRWVRMDLTSTDAISDILVEERPSMLFHLAGTRGLDQRVNGSVACAELNVCATVRLLDAALRAGVQRVIIVGSADEYGNQPGPLHEGLPLQPTSPYGISKAAASRFAQTMHARDGCPVVILRVFTAYGPGQPPDMFVAEAVACAVAGRAFCMSSGQQRRDLVFIDDVVQALIAAACAPAIEGRVINIGSGQAHRLRDIASLIWHLSESRAPLLVGARPAPAHEVHDTWADIALAGELLRWAPQIDLETGLRTTIQWARQQLRPQEQAWPAG